MLPIKLFLVVALCRASSGLPTEGKRQPSDPANLVVLDDDSTPVAMRQGGEQAMIAQKGSDDAKNGKENDTVVDLGQKTWGEHADEMANSLFNFARVMVFSQPQSSYQEVVGDEVTEVNGNSSVSQEEKVVVVTENRGGDKPIVLWGKKEIRPYAYMALIVCTTALILLLLICICTCRTAEATARQMFVTAKLADQIRAATSYGHPGAGMTRSTSRLMRNSQGNIVQMPSAHVGHSHGVFI